MPKAGPSQVSKGGGGIGSGGGKGMGCIVWTVGGDCVPKGGASNSGNGGAPKGGASEKGGAGVKSTASGEENAGADFSKLAVSAVATSGAATKGAANDVAGSTRKLGGAELEDALVAPTGATPCTLLKTPASPESEA